MCWTYLGKKRGRSDKYEFNLDEMNWENLELRKLIVPDSNRLLYLGHKVFSFLNMHLQTIFFYLPVTVAHEKRHEYWNTIWVVRKQHIPCQYDFFEEIPQESWVLDEWDGPQHDNNLDGNIIIIYEYWILSISITNKITYSWNRLKKQYLEAFLDITLHFSFTSSIKEVFSSPAHIISSRSNTWSWYLKGLCRG